jgi:hypothetical protein
MADKHSNAVLGGLLVELARCLLQYVGESSPWTGGDEAERRAINEIVARQQGEIAELAALLDARREPVRLGAYPTDFTDLQYLSLEYLLGRIIENEESLLDLMDRAAADCRGDDEALALIERLSADERENLRRLRELASKFAAADPA